MEKILVSACLLGQKCRYDGQDNELAYFAELNKYFDLVMFCPEVVGGLPTPRPRSEIKGSQVVNEQGKLVTKYFEKGAQKALELCSLLGITKAILKEGSPSCGTKLVHDGHFRNKKIPGMGLTAALLKSKGIQVMNEEEGKEFLNKYLARLETKPVYTPKEETPKRDEKGYKEARSKIHKAKLDASRRNYEKRKPFKGKPFKKKTFKREK